MKRRGFLSLLGLGGAGLLIDRAVPAMLLPEAPAVAPVVMSAGNRLFTPTWVTHEVAKAFHNSLTATGWEAKYLPEPRNGVRVGYRQDGIVMTNQLHVSLPPWQWSEGGEPTDEDELMDALRERYFRLAGVALADGVRRNDLRYLSDLPMPDGSVQAARFMSESMGLSVRGVRVYSDSDIYYDQMYERFDIIGGRA